MAEANRERAARVVARAIASADEAIVAGRHFGNAPIVREGGGDGEARVNNLVGKMCGITRAARSRQPPQPYNTNREHNFLGVDGYATGIL